MADKIISLEDHLAGVLKGENENDEKYESFLLDEGLALLAAYRAIGNRDVRLSIMTLVQTLAKEDARV